MKSVVVWLFVGHLPIDVTTHLWISRVLEEGNSSVCTQGKVRKHAQASDEWSNRFAISVKERGIVTFASRIFFTVIIVFLCHLRAFEAHSYSSHATLLTNRLDSGREPQSTIVGRWIWVLLGRVHLGWHVCLRDGLLLWHQGRNPG